LGRGPDDAELHGQDWAKAPLDSRLFHVASVPSVRTHVSRRPGYGQGRFLTGNWTQKSR
jgi:hypothetical protein